jgi:hypothetical protein
MNNNALKALIDAFSAQWRHQRADSQMTLGELISVLAAMPADSQVTCLRSAHSYRGYYEDLAFELDPGNTRPASDLLAECMAAMGNAFQGYKGGDFVMGKTTPLWVACYGSCGEKLIALNSDGSIETASDGD